MATAQLGAVFRHIRSLSAAPEWSEQTDGALLHGFLSSQDQAAFESLLRRHGPMVLRVCRRTLRHAHDAEDAFQATFLVLAQQAASIRKRESLASWLYGVAYRMATHAKRAAARRHTHEARVRPTRQPDPALGAAWQELQALLDEEIARLPEALRAAFVCCCLENKSCAEAAHQLGLGESTVRQRLSRARKLLQKRLTRRGVSLTAVLAAAAVAGNGASAALPSSLVSPMVKTAVQTVTGKGVAGGPVSANVLSLVEGVKQAMFLSKRQTMILLLLGTALLGTGLGLGFLHRARAEPSLRLSEQRFQQPANSSANAVAKDSVTVRGRVLGPHGRPLAGAELLLLGRNQSAEKLGISGTDGRFVVRVPRGDSGASGRAWYLLARAPVMGIDFIYLGQIPTGEIELHMVQDHPIRGRVVSTEGKPIKDLKVWVSELGIYGDSGGRFLAAWQKRDSGGYPAGQKHLWASGALPSVTTGADGRFTITGLGMERAAALRFRGAGFAESEVWVLNREGFDPTPYNQDKEDGLGPRWLGPLHGPEPSVVLELEKPIRGVVTDKDSGKPRAGIKVTLTRNGPLAPLRLPQFAITDAKGRYEIHGAAKASAYQVDVDSDLELGYVQATGKAADTRGYEPVTIEVAVKKGVIITGRAIDKATGKGVRGGVAVAPLFDNPFVKDYPAFDISMNYGLGSAPFDSDGTFRIVSLPGPVLLMGSPQERYRYQLLVPDKEYPRYFKTQFGLPHFLGSRSYTEPVRGVTCKVLDIKAGTEIVKQDLEFQPANIRRTKIVDEAGKPLHGTWALGISADDVPYPPVHITGDSCDVYYLEGRPRLVVFHERTRKVFGTLHLKGDEKETAVVKMTPAGTVLGQVSGEDGKPLAGLLVGFRYSEPPSDLLNQFAPAVKSVKTDPNGKFRIDGVIPGVAFNVMFRGEGTGWLVPGVKLPVAEPGKAIDLGKLKLKSLSEPREQ
jgi:RNA polymerase sigma factor (sigma-70 family)